MKPIRANSFSAILTNGVINAFRGQYFCEQWHEVLDYLKLEAANGVEPLKRFCTPLPYTWLRRH
jgi:hypothetical protein